MTQPTEEKTDYSYGILTCYDYHNSVKKEIIDEFIKNGNINYQIPLSTPISGNNYSMRGYTALHMTVKHEDYINFKVLIENGADYTIKNSNGSTAVHLVIEKIYSNPQSSKSLKMFLDSVLSAHSKMKNHVNPRSVTGLSHFHAACIRSRTKVVKLFLNHGVSVNETVDMTSQAFAGYTPMHFAVHFCSFQAAKLLLNRGSDVNCKDARGLTPLHLLVKRNMDIIDWINVSKKDWNDDLKNEYEKNEKIIVMILEKMNSIGYNQSNCNLSRLQVACILQNTSMVAQLCRKRGDSYQVVDKNFVLWPGYTALHFAAHFNVETVKLLLRNGANFFIKNAKGLAPLDLCVQRHNIESLHSIFKSLPIGSDTKLFNSVNSLTSILLAMKSEKRFSEFLQLTSNVNASILPFKVTLWPGYTLLHLAVALSTECQDISNLYEYRFYKPVVDEGINCNGEGEKMGLWRIEMCLNFGADIGVKDYHGSTPLHLAFKLKKKSAVNLLLDSHPELADSFNNDNLSYVHIACAAGNETVLKNLLAKGAFVNRALSTNYEYGATREGKCIDIDINAGSTPLHIAVLIGHVKLVELLVNYGADIYARDANDLTPIHRVLVQHLKVNENCEDLRQIASDLLLSAPNLRECKTSFGLSHLHVASLANNVVAIEKLLANGANIEETIGSTDNCMLDNELKNLLKLLDGYTALSLALQHDCKDAISALVSAGSSILAAPSKIGFELLRKHSDFLAETVIKELESQEIIKSKIGLMPLHVACALLDIERAANLLAQGADSNAQVHKDSPLWPGYTPLHFVVIRRKNHSMEIIQWIVPLLLHYGADVTLGDSQNSTAVHNAMYLAVDGKQNFQFPRDLIQAHTNFDVNPTNDVGFTHFHVACISNQIAMVEEFIKHGVDVDQSVDHAAKQLSGNSPLYSASILKYDVIVELLLKHGADIHKRNYAHKTPLHAAVSYNRPRPLQNQSEDTILTFIKAGAELHVETVLKETPLEFLLKEKQPTTDTFRYFLKDTNRVNIFNSRSNEGFIAMAISRDTSIEHLLQNSYYATVINAPTINSRDELDRTPIHNIVSIKKSSATVEVYTKALEQLRRLNFNINGQDTMGRTALHIAVQFKNVIGVKALLDLGADINITDIDGKTPLTYISEWFQPSLSEVKEVQKKILKVCFEQIYKMQYTALHVSSINISIEVNLRKYYESSSNTIKDDWRVEKEKLEIERIDPEKQLILKCFLCETGAVAFYPKMRPSQRRIIDNFFQDNVIQMLKEFPHFGGLLLLQYQKAQARVAMLGKARSLLTFATDYRLPDVCCDCVLRYFSNDHLTTLTYKI